MAYDPDTQKIYGLHDMEFDQDELDGHYSLRADDYDGFDTDAAQRRALRAGTRLNSLPPDQRTPEAIMEVRALSDVARELVIQANVALLRGN